VIVAVAGQCRKAGKTTAVCDIIAATPEARWIAVKISPHRHAPGSSVNPDTDRYRRAGAAESQLLTTLPQHFPQGRNIIVETNQPIEADFTVFIAAEDPTAEWKDSAHDAAKRAGISATGHLTREQLLQIVNTISERRS
jgi:hypothetical protein